VSPPPPRAAPARRSDALSNAQLNQRILDRGLPRNQPLPLSLVTHFERLPQGDAVRTHFFCALHFMPTRVAPAAAYLALRAAPQTKYNIHMPCEISSAQECKARGRGTSRHRRRRRRL
jgi:hypothetical protein